MPSYSFNSTIQSIIQSIINFFENLFGITKGQPIKTQSPPNKTLPKTIGKYHPPPSHIIKNTKISLPKLPILPIPIITRHNVNIENTPKKFLPKLPILPIITRNKVNIGNTPKISLPKLPILPIKIIPNKPLSQILNNSKTNNTSSKNTLQISTTTSTTNTSSLSINLSQIAINPNVPLSQTLTQGKTIIPARHKNPNPIGNNGNNSSQSNNSKSIIVNPIEYELYNTIRNSKSNTNTNSNNRKIFNKR